MSDSTDAKYYEITVMDPGDSLSGTIYKYSLTGGIKSEQHYSDVKKRKLAGPSTIYHANGKISAVYRNSANGYDGELKSYFKNGNLRRKDLFNDGKFISGNCYTESGADTTHYDYEVMPEFPGGETAMLNYIRSNVKYPALPREFGIQGRVYVQFIIDKKGSVTEAHIIRAVHPDLDKESLRVVNSMPDWKPGQLEGEPIDVIYNLPVTFLLK